MMVRDPPVARRLLGRLLSGGQSDDLVYVGATFATYFILDRITLAMVAIGQDDLSSGSLLLASFATRWWLYLPVVAVLGWALLTRGTRLLGAWSHLEEGQAMRWLLAPLVILLTWQGSLYEPNFLADHYHGSDRVILIILAIGVFLRPLFLLPFVIQSRIISEQFVAPFDTTAANDIDELLVIAIVAVAAGYVLYVQSGRQETSAVLLVLVAALGAHFFASGWAKFRVDWYSTNDLSNLPLSARTAGWLGGDGGSYAAAVSELFEVVASPLMALTLVLHLGAVVAVLHPRILQWWLPALTIFHLFVFATTGFFLLGWMLLEVGLLVIVTAADHRPWVHDDFTPARAVIAVAAVLAGPLLFHPPNMTWLDAPVAYGYEVEAVGESGATYHVPLSAFTPMDQELSFSRLQLGRTVPLSGGYGAARAEDLDALNRIVDVESLTMTEAAATLRSAAKGSREERSKEQDQAQAFIVAFFDAANARAGSTSLRAWVDPPEHFWTGSEGPTYRFQEPLTSLQVVQIATIHHAEDGPLSRLQLVLRVEANVFGNGTVVKAPGS